MNKKNRLVLLLTWVICLGPILQYGQTTKMPAIPQSPDNYYFLRNQYLKNHPKGEEEEEREKSKKHLTPVRENQSQEAFETWDRYWYNHLDVNSKIPGKMADVGKYMQDYFQGSSTTNPKGNSTASVSGNPSACQTSLGNWIPYGPAVFAKPMIGRVNTTWVNPSNFSEIYAGSASGGLFHTVNSGSYVTWTNTLQADASGNRFPSPDINTIAVDQSTSPSTIYTGGASNTPGGWGYNAGYGFGVLRSTDGGLTWSSVLTLNNFPSVETDYVRVVKIHPQDHNTVFVLAGQTVFETNNATAASPTWTAVLAIPVTGGCYFPFSDIEIIPGSSGISNSIVAVSTERYSYDGSSNSPCGSAHMYISTTGGASSSFTDVSTSILGSYITDRISMALQPGNTSDIFCTYANCGGNTTGPYFLNFDKINVSTLAVTVIANTNNDPSAGYWDLEFEFSKINPNFFYIGGQTVYKYNITGGYFTLTPFSDYTPGNTHGDVRGMTVMPVGTDRDLIVLSDDGGLQQVIVQSNSMTKPSGSSDWVNQNGAQAGSSLNITEYFGLAGSESNYNELVAGSQDNGIHEYYGGIWSQWYGGDGWKGVINPTSNTYYGYDCPGGSLAVKGVLGGALTYPGVPGGQGFGNNPIALNQNNPNNIYACGKNNSGNNDLYRSLDFGTTWTSIGFPADANEIRGIKVAPNAPDTVYVVKGNPTWTWQGTGTSNRIFMGVLSGTTWTWSDIAASSAMNGSLNIALGWSCLTDITVDPNNAKRIWVTFNGYSVASGNTGQCRVFHSPDGGANWYDATNNLPPFPVNCISYQNGSNDVLYVGTDVGVFQFSTANTTPGAGTWNCFNQGLPVVAVMGIDMNYCKSKIRIATYGRGIYESSMPVTADFVISTSTNWYGNHYVPGDIFVTNHSTLNIYGNLYMGGGKRIKVDRGSTLNVHPNAQISNGCGDMWQGIEVYGTTSSAQNLAGAQGVLIMQQGSVLSNSVEGISSAQMSGGVPVSGYTGGIVECTGAKFYNNRRSAAFYSYHWLIGGHEQPNLSYFKNCLFQTNSVLNDLSALNPHVSITDAFDVSIFGCQFANTTSNSVYSPNLRGVGISSVDGSYLIDNYNSNLTPPVLISSTSFTGLTSGVVASFTNPTGKQVSVKNAAFANTLRGVQISNGINCYVLFNTFTGIPQAQSTNMTDATYAVDMYNCSAFQVSCNSASGVYSTSSNNYGTIIDNCGSSASNVVLNNTYTNLYVGVQAQGNNGTGLNGVQFKCNTFQTGMSYQMAVCPQNTGSIAYQGSACSFGNTRQNNFFAPTYPYKQILATNAPLVYYASGVNPTVLSGLTTINWCSTVSGECSATCTQGGGNQSGREVGISDMDNTAAFTELNSPEREIVQSASYIQLGESNKALDLIAGFRKSGLTEAADFFGMALSLAQGKQTWLEASASQLARITEMANGTSNIAPYAQAVLQMRGAATYQHLIEKISPPSEGSKQNNSDGSDLSDNIPNPFQDNSAIRCIVPSEAKKALLQISSALGDIVRTYALVSGENQVVVNGTDLAAGVYYYTLFVDGQHVATKKMVVLH
jgi:hypothetical protein